MIRKKIPLLMLILVSLILFLQCNTDPNYTDNQIKAGKGDIDAYVMANAFVKERLKSPASADFPYYHERGISIKFLGDNTYSVSGYVDSQNSFGALIRTDYYCKVKYNGNDNWSLLDIKFYDD